MMIKVMLLVLALLFVSGSISAQTEIYLYADYERSAMSVQGVGVDDIVSVFLFVNAPPWGIECFELNSYTTGDGLYAVDDFYYCSEYAFIFGGFPDSDMMGCWELCQYDGWICFCMAYLLVQSDDPFCINIRGVEGQSVPRVMDCFDNWTPTVPFCNFCVNQTSSCEVAVEKSSWGAIKIMYE